MHNPLAEHFATWSRFEDEEVALYAHRAFLSRFPQYQDRLAGNPNLHPQVRTDILSSKPKIAVARALLEQGVTVQDVAYIVEHDRRDALVAMLTAYLDDDNAVLAGSAGKKSTTSIVRARHLSDATRVAVLRQRPSAAAAAVVGADIVDETVISADEIWRILITDTSKGRLPRAELSRLLWKRPDLLSKVTVATRTDILSVAAGSIGLDASTTEGAQVIDSIVSVAVHHAGLGTPWALLALSGNPKVDPDQLRRHVQTLPEGETRTEAESSLGYRRQRPQICGPLYNAPSEHLAWLTGRAFPNRYGSGRASETLELVNHREISCDPTRVIPTLTELWHAHPVYRPDIASALLKVGSSAPVEHLTYADPEPIVANDDEIAGLLQYTGLTGNVYSMDAFCHQAARQLGADLQRWDTLWALSDQMVAAKLVDLIDVAAKL